MTRRSRTLIIVAALALIAVFLLGYIPQYQRARQFETELQTNRERIRSLESDAKLAKGTQMAAAMVLEADRKNYGNASQIASEFFSHVRALTSEAADESTRTALQSVSAKQDAVVAALARGDAAVESDLQEILQTMLRISRR
jgi:hypothetical protein